MGYVNGHHTDDSYTPMPLEVTREEMQRLVDEAPDRRLAALDPNPSVAMDVLPTFLSFLFFLILGRIAHAFWRRSREEEEPRLAGKKEAAISGSPDPTPWRIQIHCN